MKSEEELKKIIDPVQKIIQEKWEDEYPGLKLYCVAIEDKELILMRWWINNQDFGIYTEVSVGEVQHPMIPDIFYYKVKQVENDFERYAVNKILNNRSFLNEFYKRREEQLNFLTKKNA